MSRASDRQTGSAPATSPLFEELLAQLGEALPVEALFDELPNVVFFVKNSSGRYVLVNRTLVERCGKLSKGELIGLLPSQVFPPDLGLRYECQDQAVLHNGRPVLNRLELHFYKSRRPGWCLTMKRPLRCRAGRVCGIIGVSRDVHEPGRKSPEYRELAAALDYMHENYASVLRIGDLAKQAGLSVNQFEQRIRRLMHLSPMQLIQKLRIDEAARLLGSTDFPLSRIAANVGYCDQSAFTRQFRSAVGITPGQFRQQVR